MDALKIADGRY